MLCPRCNAGFQCGINDPNGCWCQSVMVEDKVRTDIAFFYNGCLCQTCLQTIEDLRPPKISVLQFIKQQLKRGR